MSRSGLAPSMTRPTSQAPYGSIAPYYDRIYHWKDYSEEARLLRAAIRRYGRRGSRRLVDVACGTGEHLRYLRRWYDCAGIDQSPAMLRVARAKLPGIPFRRGEFAAFHLRTPADVLTCLFSAIGYVRTERGLRKVFRNFYRNTAPGGVVLIEPWLSPGAFRSGRPHLASFVSPGLVLARVNVSARQGHFTPMEMHHLIADTRGVRYVVERHVMRLTPIPRLEELLRRVGFRVRFLRKGLPMGRGLLVAVRPRDEGKPSTS